MADIVAVAETMTLLAPHLVSPQHPIYFQTLLENLYESAQDELLSELRSAQDAAAAWGVTPRAARMRIAKLHATYHVGRQLGGAWIIRQQDIEQNMPDVRERLEQTYGAD